MKRFSLLLLLGIMVAIAPGLVQGAPIIGELKVGGEAEITQTTIDWTPFLSGAPYNGAGDIVAVAPATGIFAGVTTGNVGVIVDRDAAGISVPPQPAGVAIFVPNWMTFSTLPGLALDLTFINPGTYTAAECGLPALDQDTCTPPAPPPFVSPYNLQNNADASGTISTNANFSVQGLVRDVMTGDTVAYFNGFFGAEFPGMSLEQILAIVSAPGGAVVATSVSGTIQAFIPEPGTVSTAVLGGLMLLGGAFVRRRMK
jgi:hypothetical protein